MNRTKNALRQTDAQLRADALNRAMHGAARGSYDRAALKALLAGQRELLAAVEALIRGSRDVKRFAVTVFVEAEDAADALLAAGDIMLDTECTVPGPNYGIRHGAELLAALGDTVIKIAEVME